ncbi:small acid-soluble spore protein P [Paenibacillus macquariensis]|uniref:Small acid-soluble spore protein P (Minor) n=1 Tax=Paenibacillus macquariensis TaxID=948756 RepID=A0ABY1KD77_9BACL|nr:small acid-soluble spore protein P [Paenibacillus macquariensis]MEC0093404.1 small acid-soluble spore protein P [Paenibacillus macquariensis]OAB29296.1 spore protein [Paenibacillus macquariensis subsp. macquariensis]SIR63730.1 small acid-soluble spore protein P (minor) [Paenibacillus macquariensis]
MSKPKAIPVPEAQEKHQRNDNDSNAMQEPLSGSKKVKNRNHVGHLNKQG